MASSVYLQGTTYPSVPSIVVPSDSLGNTASFYHLEKIWLPPSAELVASAKDTLNLSADTSYDSWTPTTTNSIILTVGTTSAACSYKITTDYQDTALIGFCLMRTVLAYPEGTTFAKGYELKKNIMSIAHYAPFKDETYSNSYYGRVMNLSAGSQQYYSSASTTTIYASTSYGVGATSATLSTSSTTSTSARTVGWTRPAINARCHSTYFSTTAANAVDSANSNIYFDFRIYKIDKTESLIYSLFDETNGLFYI